MVRPALEGVSFYTKNLYSYKKPWQRSICAASSKLRFFSSDDSSSTKTPNPLPATAAAGTQIENNSSDAEEECVSEAELQKRIDKYVEGDEEAIPSILEGILRRKLAGIREKGRLRDGFNEENELGADYEYVRKDSGLKSDSENLNLRESDKMVAALLDAREILKKTLEKKQ